MCGRYSLKTPVERLSEKFQFPKVIPIRPRYNTSLAQEAAAALRAFESRQIPCAPVRGLALAELLCRAAGNLASAISHGSRTLPGKGSKDLQGS